MSGAAVTTAAEKVDRFFPIGIDSLDAHTLTMDLYLKPAGVIEPVLYRAAGVDFSEKDRRRLASQGIQFLYVPLKQHAEYRRHLTDRLEKHFRDPHKQREERIRAVRASCTKIIEDALLFPGQAGAVAAVADIAQQFTAWSAEDNSQFSYLLDMSAHDYYTTTHMMNVGVGCGLLIREVKPGETELQAQIIHGGLLHDIGKRAVPEEILNKEGRLDDQEWELIRKHPGFGCQDLDAHRDVPDSVREMVRDHHERLDGKGYPAGRAGEQVGFAARICAVVDVFDAICARRPYRGATPPLETLAIMREAVGTQFDADLFATWDTLVKRLIAEDPERALPPRPDPPRLALRDFAPAPAAASADESPSPQEYEGANRRQHVRYPCSLSIQGALVRHGDGHCSTVNLGEWVPMFLVDVSRGGVQLRTSFPLATGAVLLLELPIGRQHTVRRTARVLHVRQASEQEWAAGLCFLGDD
jgi:HD-GYP domain-containing protein (c-di-GMP phosphodiesterase class II)